MTNKTEPDLSVSTEQGILVKIDNYLAGKNLHVTNDMLREELAQFKDTILFHIDTINKAETSSRVESHLEILKYELLDACEESLVTFEVNFEHEDIEKIDQAAEILNLTVAQFSRYALRQSVERLIKDNENV